MVETLKTLVTRRSCRKLKYMFMLALSAVLLLTACKEAVYPRETEKAYTEDELLLQKAWWYLQDDEKALVAWDQGTILNKEYKAENPRTVIGPEGGVEIQGRKLTQIRYLFCNMFFDNGTFVGMDYGAPEYGSPVNNQWNGTLQCWLFLDKQDVPLGGEQSYVFLIRNTGKRELNLMTGDFEIDICKGGEQVSGGRELSMKYVTLQPGEFYRVEDKWLVEEGNHSIWSAGEYTVMASIMAYEGQEAHSVYDWPLTASCKAHGRFTVH